MKIIFLDIDGVLNSLSYYEKVNILDNPLDDISVLCLKKIVDKTNAKIVLSSSWRGGWNKNEKLCGYQGKVINKTFKKYNLRIFDRTESLNFNDGTARSREIIKWLHHCPYKIHGFVIIDDGNFAWKKFGLYDRWIQTNFKENGLQEKHIQEAINILKRKSIWLCIRNLYKKNYIDTHN